MGLGGGSSLADPVELLCSTNKLSGLEVWVLGGFDGVGLGLQFLRDCRSHCLGGGQVHGFSCALGVVWHVSGGASGSSSGSGSSSSSSSIT